MSIDNIQLSGYLCQNMFAKSLIGEIQTTNSNELPKKTKIASLGENKRNILFLVNNKEFKFLSDKEMKLLSDLISACKLSMADISLVNFNQNPGINYQDLVEQFHSKKILIFGIALSELQLPFTIPFFQIQKFQEQVYLTNPSLEDFISNVNLKKELWNCLKKIFLQQ
ncbi:MAG TPA: hypothetical protein VGW31_16030 [Hanamia sp.]|nr:hypothetical protein [Hanamia sp.]